MVRKKTKSPKFVSRRYEKAIKEGLNSHLKTCDQLNKELSKIIRDFSHKSLVSHGSYLMDKRMEYFVVQKVLSTHFVRGFFCPSRIVQDREEERYWYEPYTFYRSPSRVKKLMNPFSPEPYIKERSKKYYIVDKQNATLSDFRDIIRRLTDFP